MSSPDLFDAAPAPPPQLGRFDAAAFRQTLAGLADPYRPTGGTEATALKNEAVAFGLCLCRLYNRGQLDAVKIWDKIDAAFKAGAEKAPAGDVEYFAALCLETVLADPNALAAERHWEGPVQAWLAANADPLAKDESYRVALLRYVATRRPVLVGLLPAAWEAYKARTGWPNRKDGAE